MTYAELKSMVDTEPTLKKHLVRAWRDNNPAKTMVTYRGETLCLVDWGHRYKLKPSTIRSRIMRGWSDEKAITKPARNRVDMYE